MKSNFMNLEDTGVFCDMDLMESAKNVARKEEKRARTDAGETGDVRGAACRKNRGAKNYGPAQTRWCTGKPDRDA